jgi:hypothetical protein
LKKIMNNLLKSALESEQESDRAKIVTVSAEFVSGGGWDGDKLGHRQALKAAAAAICTKALQDAGFKSVVNNIPDVHGKVLTLEKAHQKLRDAKTDKGADEDDALTSAIFDVPFVFGPQPEK